MLTQVDVECDNPFYMSVLGANPRDSLIIQSITGLGPPDKTLFLGDYASDGGLYTGRRVTMRNPVMTIQMNPNFGNDETMDGLRQLLYEAFNDPNEDGDDVTVILHDDIKPDRYFVGYTEKFDGEAFGQDNVCQVSMMCPDPFLRDVAMTVIQPSEGSAGWQTVPFTYSGSARAGFEVTIDVTSDTSILTLDNNGSTMVLSYPFLSGDEVYINTNPGERVIQYTRAGVTYDIFYTLDDSSPWLRLHTQSNDLQVYGTVPANVVAAISNLTYTQLYWGI